MCAINKIKMYRVGVGLSQEAMAKELGMSANSYRAKELGDSEFTATEIKKYMNVVSKTFADATIEDIFFN